MEGSTQQCETVTDAGVGPRWIVLTPSVDHEAWLKALSNAATSHGVTLCSVFEPPNPAATPPGPALYVTADAALAQGTDSRSVAILMPQPETAAEAVGALYAMHPPHSVFHATVLLSRAVSVNPGARLFTGEALARNPEQIEPFPGFIVRPPIPERGSPKPAVSAALALFRRGRPAVGETVDWSERLFIYDPKSCVDDAPIGLLDISGRPRTLLYGPYLALPIGRWKAVMRFGIDADGASHELRFDWGVASDFVAQAETPGRPGVYEIALTHSVTTCDDLWQFRILVLQGVFEGRMTFHGGSVTRVPDEEGATV